MSGNPELCMRPEPASSHERELIPPEKLEQVIWMKAEGLGLLAWYQRSLSREKTGDKQE